MSTDHVIHAELEIHRCTAELYVNDLPIGRLGPHTTSLLTVPVHQYLVPGSNELELLVEPGPRPSLARTGQSERRLPGARATARLMRYPDGVFAEPENGELLLEVDWRAKSDQAEPFPQSLARRVELGAAYGPWVLQSAPELALDETTIEEALAVLDEVADALRSGSASRVLAAIEVNYREGLRAYPANDPAQLLAELQAFLASLGRVERPIIEPNRDRIDFRRVARGRVLECVDEDWSTSLKLRDEEGHEVPYSVLLARIDGRLRLVR